MVVMAADAAAVDPVVDIVRPVIERAAAAVPVPLMTNEKVWPLFIPTWNATVVPPNTLIPFHVVFEAMDAIWVVSARNSVFK